MTFQAIVPLSGYSGWRFLQKTFETQKERYAASPEIKRDEDYFRAKIGTVSSAADLVADRRLLKVALGAFGLSDDLNHKAFIQKILESDTSDKGSLANRLSNKAYLSLAEAFGFGSGETQTTTDGFPDRILDSYTSRGFETAVGEQDNTLRLALNAQRELADLAGKTTSEASKWYTVIASAPLREVFETALGLPSSFASIDIDVQMRTLRTKLTALTGDGRIEQFTEPEALDKLIRYFTLRSSLDGTASSAGSSPALTILQGSASSNAGSILQILLSR